MVFLSKSYGSDVDDLIFGSADEVIRSERYVTTRQRSYHTF